MCWAEQRGGGGQVPSWQSWNQYTCKAIFIPASQGTKGHGLKRLWGIAGSITLLFDFSFCSLEVHSLHSAKSFSICQSAFQICNLLFKFWNFSPSAFFSLPSWAYVFILKPPLLPFWRILPSLTRVLFFSRLITVHPSVLSFQATSLRKSSGWVLCCCVSMVFCISQSQLFLPRIGIAQLPSTLLNRLYSL